MKPASNSSVSRFEYLEAAAIRVSPGRLNVPGYVWLAMIVIAALAISISTAVRSREQARNAQASFQQTSERIRLIQAENEQIRARVRQLRDDPRANEQVAREQLHYLSQNEVAVKVK